MHAPHRAGLLGLVARLDDNAIFALLDIHLVNKGHGQFALGTFDGQRSFRQRRRDAAGNGDREFTDT